MGDPFADFSVSVSHGHPEVDFLSPPLQSVQQVSIQCTKRGHVENLDTWTSVCTHQEPGEYWKDSGLGFSTRCGGYQKDVFSFEDRRNRPFLGFSWLFESSFLDSFRSGIRQKVKDRRRQLDKHVTD